jgi:hypothetical protein
MIPEFNVDGNLPEGIYRIGESETLQLFFKSLTWHKKIEGTCCG